MLFPAVQAQEAEEMRVVTEAALATPKGQKKDFSTEMPKTYDPTYVEAALYAPRAPYPLSRRALSSLMAGALDAACH